MQSLQATTLAGTSTTIDAATLEAFTGRLRGASLLQGDIDYEKSRIIWNGSVDKKPALIIRCSGAADVIDAVNFARRHDLLVAVRGGGHNVAGNAVCDGGVVIDLSAMNSVRVDPVGRRAQVDGGALLGDVDRETQAFGLAAPLGVVSLTGVAGLTLCGGLGYLRRKHGMSCDALVSVDVVTADGSLVHANSEQNTDLFWGVRGGGGNFGIVTSFEFELFPVGPTVTLCAPFYRTDENTPEIVRAWRDYMENSDEELTSNCLFWSVPAHPNFPEELHGIPVVIPAVIHIGELNGAEQTLQPMRELGEPILDLSGPIPFVDLQQAFDPLFVKGERQNYWKSLYLDSLDDKAIEQVVQHASSRPDPWSLVAIWHLGGAMNRVDPTTTALGERSANFLYSLDSSWTDPAHSSAAIEWTREAWGEMKPYSRGGTYLNFPGQGEEGETMLRASYGNENYERLLDLKRKYDPSNLFRLNQNIAPD